MISSKGKKVIVSVLVSMGIFVTGVLCLVQMVMVQYVGTAPLSGLLWTGYPLCLGGQINLMWAQVVRSTDRLEPLGTLVRNVRFWSMPSPPMTAREKGAHDARLMETNVMGSIPLRPEAFS